MLTSIDLVFCCIYLGIDVGSVEYIDMLSVRQQQFKHLQRSGNYIQVIEAMKLVIVLLKLLISLKAYKQPMDLGSFRFHSYVFKL